MDEALRKVFAFVGGWFVAQALYVFLFHLLPELRKNDDRPK
jgi:hypothetical protein